MIESLIYHQTVLERKINYSYLPVKSSVVRLSRTVGATFVTYKLSNAPTVTKMADTIV